MILEVSILMHLIIFSLYIPNIYKMVKHDSQKDYQILTNLSTRLSALGYLIILICAIPLKNTLLNIGGHVRTTLPFRDHSSHTPTPKENTEITFSKKSAIRQNVSFFSCTFFISSVCCYAETYLVLHYI